MFCPRAGRDTVHSSCLSPGACPVTIVSTLTSRLLAIASILDISHCACAYVASRPGRILIGLDSRLAHMQLLCLGEHYFGIDRF